jgi:hypothetical protein
MTLTITTLNSCFHVTSQAVLTVVCSSEVLPVARWHRTYGQRYSLSAAVVRFFLTAMAMCTPSQIYAAARIKPKTIINKAEQVCLFALAFRPLRGVCVGTLDLLKINHCHLKTVLVGSPMKDKRQPFVFSNLVTRQQKFHQVTTRFLKIKINACIC